ncbi:MAG: transposase, partial [Candidatus Sulfotelmatobacter sp.]
MKRARFTEEQIIGVLNEHEAGAKTADLARKHGVSEGTLYNWKAKYGGMDASEAKRLKQLEDENAKLKKLLAEQMLDAAAMIGSIPWNRGFACVSGASSKGFWRPNSMPRWGAGDMSGPASRPASRAE